MAHDVFISYSSKDQVIAKAVCGCLEKAGIQCWIAPRDIIPGKEWAEAIIDGIVASRALVLIFSSHANESSQIHRELERAAAKGITIIPFRIEEINPIRSMEFFLGNIHWLNAFPPPADQYIEQLVGTVQEAVEKCVSVLTNPNTTAETKLNTHKNGFNFPAIVASAGLLGGALALAQSTYKFLSLGEYQFYSIATLVWLVTIAMCVVLNAPPGVRQHVSISSLRLIIALISSTLYLFSVSATYHAHNDREISLAEISLRFHVDFEPGDNEPPNLSFLHMRPRWKGPQHLAQQPSGLYETPVQLPLKENEYVGSFTRLVHASVHSGPRPSPQPTRLCFLRNTFDPEGWPDYAILNCIEGKGCQRDEVDPGWASSCPGKSHSTWFFGLPVALADSLPTNETVGDFWLVPSLETLRKEERERVGYTEFQLITDPLPDLKAEYFTYFIKVNGTPIFIDGWPPEYLHVPFDASKGVSLSFGLENLDFSGRKDGFEDIEVQVRFYYSDRLVKSVKVSRKYAALRDAEAETIEAEEGLTFRWEGTYIKPKKENKFEIFVLSTTDIQEARDRRRRIEAKKLDFENQPIVGVIRPPLGKSPSYGIVIGLRKQTGQVQFTFDEQVANKLCKLAVQVRSNKGGTSIIAAQANRYEMEPRAPRTPRYRLCENL